ncbi:MAG: DNA-processing protein DprA [bacterium]|nr:DNA-processing protein DprA [bacterium]
MDASDSLNEKKFYNALCVLHRGDPLDMKKLQARFASWAEAWTRSVTGQKVDSEKEWDKLLELGVSLAFRGDADFPALLAEAHDCPIAIYYKGDLLKDGKSIVVVGTRRATPVAKGIAKDIASQLAKSGVAVISGLAMGIDAAAHEGALAGGGKTIAVLANSLDSVYPRQNENLAERILKAGGALISEYALGSETFPNRFLERNRIVSGLAPATLVIEAPENSGSLVTANLALEQNREVFVVPGPISHENYYGSHKLIRAGARLVTSTAEILEDLNWQIEAPAAEQLLGLPVAGLTSDERLIFDTLRSAGEALEVDSIQEITKMSIPAITRNLTFLQIKGLIKESGGRYYISNR